MTKNSGFLEYFGSYKIKSGSESYYVIVLEYIDGIDLEDFVNNQ